MESAFESGLLLIALLNPFLLVVYLIGPMNKLNRAQFRNVLIRAGCIAVVVFVCFAFLGDAVFSVIGADFASFQIFGGIVFVLIGLQFMFKGPRAIELLQGEAMHISGAIAMPVMIGPGTISVSVIIGKRHDLIESSVIVFAAVFVSLAIVFVLKAIHDFVRARREALIERYIDIAGRIMALYTGTVAIEMIMRGLASWIEKW